MYPEEDCDVVEIQKKIVRIYKIQESVAIIALFANIILFCLVLSSFIVWK